MDVVAVIPWVIAGGLGTLAVITFIRLERQKSKAKELEIQLASAAGYAQSLEKQLGETESLRKALMQEKEAALRSKLEAEKEVALAGQQVKELEKRMQDWQTQREESLKAAKASILEAGGMMSSKLLEDHKREVEAAKKESEEITRKTTEALLSQVTNVTQIVASLKDQTAENKEKVAVVMKALSTPAGAGYLAEVGLENSLKNLGLEVGRDFIMQYAIGQGESAGLRPDAVVFLPQDMVMVVDSKASKYALEIAEAQGTEREAEALEALKRSMNTHLKALTSKDYSSAIVAAYKEAGKGKQLGLVFNIMYLPSENVIENIKRADPEFLHKVEKAGLILAGPASLAGLFSLARMNIGMARQAENQQVIMDVMSEVMESAVTLFGYADKVGKGIKSAADNFDQFARSVNKRLLPKLRSLVSLGVKPSKAKELPGRITSYEVRAADDHLTIDGEVADKVEVFDLPYKEASGS